MHLQQHHGRGGAGVLGHEAGQWLCRGRTHRCHHRHRRLPPRRGAGRCSRAGPVRGAAALLHRLPQPREGMAGACGRHLGAGAAHPVHPQREHRPADHRLQCGRHRQLLLVQAGRLHLPAHRAGEDQLHPHLCHAPEQCAQPHQRAQGAGKAAAAPAGPHRHHPCAGR